MKLFLHLILFIFIMFTSFAEDSTRANQRIEEISNQINHNRMMTQIHRWYLFYENHKVNLNEQLDILTDDITVKSALGERHGKDGYIKAVTALPKTWSNSHHILKTEFKGFKSNFAIVYQNIGMLEEGKLLSRNTYYDAEFVDNGDVLPKFKSIIISSKEEEEVQSGYSKFIDAYPENRLRALVYYYLSLIEFKFAPQANFKHIFNDEIHFKFSDREIKSHEEFFTWLQEARQNVFIASHIIKNFSYKNLENNLYQIEMEFDWSGFLEANKNQELEATTLHKWIVSDNPAEKFAKIKSIEVKFIKPFTPIDSKK